MREGADGGRGATAHLVAYLRAGMSSQPILRGRPVVVPYSAPIARSSSAKSPWISVGYGPDPTRVVYALACKPTPLSDTDRPYARVCKPKPHMDPCEAQPLPCGVLVPYHSLRKGVCRIRPGPYPRGVRFGL
jgi:hypothetical protein